MSKKIYRTAQGRIVDFGAIQAQNEQVRAVGNMNVNARGDKLDADGNIISTRAQQVNRNLNRTTTGPIPTSTHAQKNAEVAAIRAADQEKLEQARLQRQALRAQGVTPPVEQPTTGLAAAMARAAKQPDEE